MAQSLEIGLFRFQTRPPCRVLCLVPMMIEPALCGLCHFCPSRRVLSLRAFPRLGCDTTRKHHEDNYGPHRL